MNLPQELIDKIIDGVWDADDSPSHATTKAASLISWAWVNRSQHHLFRSVKFCSIGDQFGRWCSAVTPGPNGVSRYVRSLTIQATWPSGQWIDEDFLECALPYFDSFRNVQALQVINWNVASFPPQILARCFTPFAEGIRLLQWEPHRDMARETWIRIVNFFPLVDHLLFHHHFFHHNSPRRIQLPLATPADAIRKKLTFSGTYAASYLIESNLRFQEIHVGCSLGMLLETLIKVIDSCADKLEILLIVGINRVMINPSNVGTLSSFLGRCHALRELSLEWVPTNSDVPELYLIDAIPGDCIQLLRIMPSQVLWEYQWADSLPDTAIPWLKAAHKRLAKAINRLGMRFSSKNYGRKIPVRFVIPRVPYIMCDPIKDSVAALWEVVEDAVSLGFEMTEAELRNIDKRHSISGLES